jgi:hypothetical protein
MSSLLAATASVGELELICFKVLSMYDHASFTQVNNRTNRRNNN